jgi:signal-induced proliferation-associated 1 like protein 1
MFSFSVAVSRSKDVPSFGPHIPENVMFPKSAEFADFIMAKGKSIPQYIKLIC